VRIFEPHIHMYARTTDDYEALALAGVRTIVEPSFWLGQRRTQVGSFLDYWSAIRDYEWQRAKAATIEQYHTVSVNPREANDEPLARAALAEMPPFLDHPRCVAVGEIGFDDVTPAEERLLAEQLVLAREKGLPALVHSCHRQKKRGTERTIEILKDLDYDPDLVLYDHNTEETIGLVRDYGCWAGLTVYPHTKLSPERAANVLEEYGTERTCVNSSADWGPSDVLSVPRVVVELRRRGWEDERIEGVVWDNPRAFYAQSGRLTGIAAEARETAR
jgi:predicted metal-dependent TIM-barrel fold hydrolase